MHKQYIDNILTDESPLLLKTHIMGSFKITVSSNEVDETGAYYTDLSKPERKTPIQYTNAYIYGI